MMTDDDRRMLDFAGRWWRTAGAAEDAIRREFGISVTRFWQRVAALSGQEDAIAYAPLLTAQIRRLMDVPNSQRHARSRPVTDSSRLV